MVQLAQEYVVAELPEDNFQPIPAGTYKALIVGSEMKDTASGNGRYLQLEIDITEGDHKGRKVFERLNLENPNQTAVEIAFKTLGGICKAIGLEKVGDSNQMHNRPFLVDIDIEVGKPYVKDGVEKQGSDQNRIKRYLPFEKGAVTAPADKRDGEGAGSEKAPWAR